MKMGILLLSRNILNKRKAFRFAAGAGLKRICDERKQEWRDF
jgi:hypothetical protein